MDLTGPIPAWLGNLSNLESLSLHYNDLSGPVPAWLGSLSNLSLLGLCGNQFTGTIPPELGNLSSLGALYLNDNELTGPIPPELGDLSNLVELRLESNELAGLVPLSVAERGGIIQHPDQTYYGYCRFVPPGNEGLYMPDTQAYRDADLDGDGYICGLGLTATLEVVATDLRDAVTELYEEGVLNQGQSHALTVKIDQAMELLEKDKYAEAIQVVQDFIQQVNDLTYIDFVLTEEQAQPLIERAEILIDLIEMEMGT